MNTLVLPSIRKIFVAIIVLPIINCIAFAGDFADEVTSGEIAVFNTDYDFGFLTIDFTPVGTSGQFQDYFYDVGAQEFVEVVADNDSDFILTADGWVPTIEDYAITAFSGNNVSVTSSLGESVLLNGEDLDSSNKTAAELIKGFAQSLNDQEDKNELLTWLAYIDPTFSFSGAAEVFQVTATELAQSYFLWVPQGCEGVIDDECWYTYMENNGHPQGAMSSLGEMYTEIEWNGQNNSDLMAASIAWGESGALKAEFIESETSSGLVNFYFHQYANNLTRKIAYGRWQRVQVMGTELVLLELSDDLVKAARSLVDIEDTRLLYSVFGGYVRNGGYYIEGQVDSEDPEIWMNMTALEQLISNFEVVDTDGDGIVNHLDDDDDGDGVNDEDDAFPLLAAEWEDTDGDGIGNNQDSDDDNDGTNDDADLAPVNPRVSVAIEFTADDVNELYTQISPGALDNPNFSMASSDNGALFEFMSDGTFVESFPDGSLETTWSLENNVLTIHQLEVYTENFDAQTLVDAGVITQQTADSFIETFGFVQIEVSVNEVEVMLLMLENSDTEDRFWARTLIEYQIVNDEHREALLGNINAAPLEVWEEGEEVIVTQTDSITPIGFELDDLMQPMALPVFVDLQEEFSGVEGVAVDLITFNQDNTATGTLFNKQYTWQILDGELILTQANGAVITAQRVGQFDPGAGVFTTYTSPDELFTYSQYSLFETLAEDASIAPLLNNFLMSGSVLTDPSAYDENNQILPDRYFGYASFEDGSGITLFNGDFSLVDESGDGNGWYSTPWNINQDGEVHADLTFSTNSGQFGCDAQTDNACSVFLSRRFIPLQVTNNRMYAIEWRVRNLNAFSPGAEEDWVFDIVPRVQFYEIFELDLDGDGTLDADDAFPFDIFEWTDNDNDGTGNNLDPDDDDDGISDFYDAYPLIAIGNYLDTDGDGAPDECDTGCVSLGMAADDDDDNDGVLDVDDAYPLDPEKWESLLKAKKDLNGDGNADILWRNTSSGQNWLWTMNGRSILKSAGINKVADQTWQIVGRGDFDGDGMSDILWRNSASGRNYIYLMDGFSIKQAGQLNYVTDLGWQVAEVADFDGDGKDDVLWRHANSGATWIYLMNGMKTSVSKGSSKVADLNWEIVASGDVNGDGNADVIWRHKTRGDNYIWLMNGISASSKYKLNRVSSSWSIAGAGDINGDGTDDIIWRNQNDGRNWAYLMNGGQIQSSELINKVANTNWQIADISDLDGDGDADLFWREMQSGKNYIYLMNGLSISSSGYSKSVSTSWQVLD